MKIQGIIIEAPTTIFKVMTIFWAFYLLADLPNTVKLIYDFFLLTVGSHISIGSLNGPYMDIAQPQSQYPSRQDSAMFFQDDLYANSMPPSFSTIGKPYFAAAFR